MLIADLTKKLSQKDLAQAATKPRLLCVLRSRPQQIQPAMAVAKLLHQKRLNTCILTMLVWKNC